jgi:HEAT repeat protein
MGNSDENSRVVSALKEKGIVVSNIYDLVNTNRSYKDAIPVLIGLLSEVQDMTIKEGIIRALAVKEAVGSNAVDQLVAEFKRPEVAHSERGQLLKWVIGNTLSVIAKDGDFSQLAELARDKQHGKAREMIVVALGNMRQTPEAIDVLIDLLNDEEVCGHAAKALGNLRAKKAEKELKKLLNHRVEWIRKSAKHALENINKSP